MKLNEETKNWLLDSEEPYIRYLAQRLFDPSSADPGLLDDDLFVRENLSIVANWRDEVLERHDKPGLMIHRLAMLADLGVTAGTRGTSDILDDLVSNISDDGSFRLPISIPKAFGGTGEASDEWIICDFPVVVYALAKMGVDDSRLSKAVDKLESLAGESFYPCCGSIPGFKGPGPRDGMCPYANLLVAQALSVAPKTRSSDAAKLAAGTVLDLWDDRKSRKPFLFAMGTDFRKLKFPMVWFNLLHVLYGLRDIEGVRDDVRYKQMLDILRDKLDADGRVRPESIYMIYKRHEWSDKKNPSRLLTVFSHMILGTGS